MTDRSVRILLTKSDDWSYEKEFRLVSTSEHASPNPLTLHGDCFVLPFGALKAVIVGCNGDYDAVRRVVKDNAPALPVKRAVRTANHYRLAIADEASLESP